MFDCFMARFSMFAPRRVQILTALLLAVASCDRPSPSTQRIKTEDIEVGPLRRDSLTPQQVDRLRAIRAALAEVDKNPLEKWIDAFRRDADPDREISIYEAIAQAYQTFCAVRPRTASQKQDAYGLLIERSGTTDDDALRNYKLKALTPSNARELLSYYTKSPEPIQVFKK
jgi:hypothetical protein